MHAARLFGVPRSTLRDRVTGNVKHGTKPGPAPYLTKSEETELASFLVDVAKAGYGKSRGEVKRLAENVARDKNVLKRTKISDGCYRRFMERQSHLSLRKGDPTANVQMDCLNPETMKQYFDLLKMSWKTMISWNLQDEFIMLTRLGCRWITGHQKL